MNRSRNPLLSFFLAWLLVLTLAPLLQGEDPLFIGDLEQKKDEYLGKSIRVEGRGTIIDRFKLRLRNSQINFESRTELQTFVVRPSNLEALGKLAKDGNSYKFIVTSMEAQKSDSDQLSRKRIALDRNSPQEHYDLAEWAKKRGEFYQDEQLKTASRELTLQGYRIESSLLSSDDSEGRLTLARKGIELGVPDSLREELIHAAYRARIRSTLKMPQPDWDQVAAQIARDCPGAETAPPDSPEFQKRREDYFRSPESVYKAADHLTRLQFHRLLWGEVKRHEFMDRAKRNPALGLSVADELEKLLPEYRADADRLRDEILMQRGGDVDKYTRREIVQLREDYLARKKPEEAERVVTDWLASRKKKLKDDDLEGLLQLAADYDSLERDGSLLAPALISAAVTYPDSTEIAAALEKIGYRIIDGKWLSPSDRELHSNSQFQKELKEGLVTIGMTAAEVRKSQGVPTSLTRIASNGELREIWSYGRPGDQGGLTIYLRKSHLDPQAKVFAVGDLKTR